MIKVVIKDNDSIKEITISGHAFNDVSGKDIVCASVSSIVITTVNAIIRLDDKAISYEEKDGFISIKNHQDDKTTNILLNNMIDLLNELCIKYPKNIQMKRG